MSADRADPTTAKGARPPQLQPTWLQNLFHDLNKLNPSLDPSRLNPPLDPSRLNPPQDPSRLNPPQDPSRLNPPQDPSRLNSPQDPSRLNSPQDPSNANLSQISSHSQLYDTSGLSLGEGYAYLSSLVQRGKVDFNAVTAYELPTKWMSELDVNILNDPPLTSLKAIANVSTSSLHIEPLTETKSTWRALQVGDVLKVRVDLRDAEGQPVRRGGDEVRVWARSTESRFRSMQSQAATAEVVDLGNGSYAATLPLLWAGRLQVVAALVRPRQFKTVMLRLLNTMKSLFQITAGFVRESGEERGQTTLCMPVPTVPGYREVCDLTAQNDGLPWFCGRPTKPNLTCAHWVLSRSTQFPLHFPVRDGERELFRHYFKGQAKHLLPGSPTFFVENSTKAVQALPSCSERPAVDSWSERSPRGVWDGGRWRPLHCSLPALSTPWIDSCLHNTTLLLLGDSNLRLMLLALRSLWQCRMQQEGRTFHDSMHCVGRSNSGALISYHPHAYPFFTRSTWISRFTRGSPSSYMRAVSGGGRLVVLLHLYAHHLVVHSYIIGLHVRHAAEGVRALLSRRPDVRVLVRGPHAVLGSEKRVIGDHHAERTWRIIRREFRGLRDRVIYLDAWDMTVASENFDIHPPVTTNIELVRLFLGHVCPPEEQVSL